MPWIEGPGFFSSAFRASVSFCFSAAVFSAWDQFVKSCDSQFSDPSAWVLAAMVSQFRPRQNTVIAVLSPGNKDLAVL
jgi:hypothetical protein